MNWDCRDEADDEVAGLKQDSAGAVFPDALESELELAVGAKFQAVLSKRRACDIPAEALDLSSVAAVDALASVEVNAADFSDGVPRTQELPSDEKGLLSPVFGRDSATQSREKGT